MVATLATPIALKIAEVLLPLPLAEAFDYAVPAEMELSVGDLVAVPLGPRTVMGVVTAMRDGAGTNRALRPVAERLAAGAIGETTLAFVRWAARYAVDAPGEALAITLRGRRAPQARPERRLAATGEVPLRLTPARARVLAAAAAPIRSADLRAAAAASPTVIRGLLAAGALREILAEPEVPLFPTVRPSLAALDSDQAAAAGELIAAVARGGFSVSLLDGVTGSGKTFVYMEAAAAALAADPQAQVLVLIPEIALTQAVLDRFAERFGGPAVEWHSALSGARRRQAWEAARSGAARIVVGARSALFLPFRRLCLTIVDEEHDASYKQEEGFIYQARDLAVARGRLEAKPVILASATPSLETRVNASAGRYRWLKLPARAGGSLLPQISLVDLRASPPASGEWLSPELAAAMGETLEAGEQSLLFLNRRGYAPLVLCRACGERLKAPDTDSWLVEHRYSGRLVCHLTGFSMAKPLACPRCGAEGSLASVGPGVERIEEEVRRRLPNARTAVFSSDTVPDAASARRLIAAMSEGEIDVLIATQAAAKGHDFPHLTLVGAVDADLGLRGGDLRAAERTFQLLTQVSGRAGRRERPGRALIQTWAPDHPLMQALAAGDGDRFFEIETAERRAAGLPPFTRLAALILSGRDPARLADYARRLAAAAPAAEGVDVFGPADPPYALVRGLRRKRFLIRARRSVDIQAFVSAWLATARPPSWVRLAIDVDPYSFL